jgi:hypothetical protein
MEDYSALVRVQKKEVLILKTLNMAKWRFQEDLADLKNQ